MRFNKSKSFQRSVSRSDTRMGYTNNASEHEPISILAILQTIFAGIKRLWMAMKYQVFRLLPGTGRLPWIKLAIAALLIFVVFKRDLQFQFGLRNPATSQDTNGPVETSFSTAGSLAQIVSLEKEEKPPVDPFMDQPGDSEEDRMVKAYIRRFKQVAITEMDQYHIPASIKLAQGILESNAGKSRLAKKNNNHFGIKCFSKSCGKGHCSNFSDDHHKDFFRKYESAWASWRAHSKLLNQKRYKPLQDHGNDYKAWAKGLKKLGYATDKNYEQKLIDKIEQYQLYTLDQ